MLLNRTDIPQPEFTVQNGEVGIYFAGVTKLLCVEGTTEIAGVHFAVDASEEAVVSRCFSEEGTVTIDNLRSRRLGDGIWVSWYTKLPNGTASVVEGMVMPSPKVWTLGEMDAIKPEWKVVGQGRLRVTAGDACGIVSISNELKPTQIGNILVWAMSDFNALTALINEGGGHGIAPVDIEGSAHIVWRAPED